MAVLELRRVAKSFGGKTVLRDLELTVPENSIFAFVGRNGAGKTTTMNIILGLLRADAGEVFVCGERVKYGETPTNRHIGYLPDVPEFYSYMTAREYLRLCGEIAGLSKNEISVRSDELLHLVGLADVKTKSKTFSRGMKQRLGLAQALINQPKLLICDEPTSALDPIGRKEILDILAEVKGKTTVLFSTHILSDVERVCDHIALLDQGKIVLKGRLHEILAGKSGDEYLIEFSEHDELERFSKLLAAKRPEIKAGAKAAINHAENPNSLIISLEDAKSDGRFILNLLAQENILPVKFEKIEPSLESLFEELVK